MICKSDALVDGGAAVRFRVRRAGEVVPAFVVRYDGVVRAYVNRCAHRGVELDWEPGRFFDGARRWLMCATHGALYDPVTGGCAGGPCSGAGLAIVPVIETNGSICLAQTIGLELA